MSCIGGLWSRHLITAIKAKSSESQREKDRWRSTYQDQGNFEDSPINYRSRHLLFRSRWSGNLNPVLRCRLGNRLPFISTPPKTQAKRPSSPCHKSLEITDRQHFKPTSGTNKKALEDANRLRYTLPKLTANNEIKDELQQNLTILAGKENLSVHSAEDLQDEMPSCEQGTNKTSLVESGSDNETEIYRDEPEWVQEYINEVTDDILAQILKSDKDDEETNNTFPSDDTNIDQPSRIPSPVEFGSSFEKVPAHLDFEESLFDSHNETNWNKPLAPENSPLPWSLPREKARHPRYPTSRFIQDLQGLLNVAIALLAFNVRSDRLMHAPNLEMTKHKIQFATSLYESKAEAKLRLEKMCVGKTRTDEELARFQSRCFINMHYSYKKGILTTKGFRAILTLFMLMARYSSIETRQILHMAGKEKKWESWKPMDLQGNLQGLRALHQYWRKCKKVKSDRLEIELYIVMSLHELSKTLLLHMKTVSQLLRIAIKARETTLNITVGKGMSLRFDRNSTIRLMKFIRRLANEVQKAIEGRDYDSGGALMAMMCINLALVLLWKGEQIEESDHKGLFEKGLCDHTGNIACFKCASERLYRGDIHMNVADAIIGIRRIDLTNSKSKETNSTSTLPSLHQTLLNSQLQGISHAQNSEKISNLLLQKVMMKVYSDPFAFAKTISTTWISKDLLGLD